MYFHGILVPIFSFMQFQSKSLKGFPEIFLLYGTEGKIEQVIDDLYGILKATEFSK